MADGKVGKIFANYTAGKGLIFLIFFKNYKKLKTKCPIEKRDKEKRTDSSQKERCK